MPRSWRLSTNSLRSMARLVSLSGCTQQVAVLADGEVAFAPTGDVVEFSGFRSGPSISGLANGAVRKSGGGGHETSVSTDLPSGASEKWFRG